MMISASDGDAARRSCSSLLSLLNHYSVCLCFGVPECNVMQFLFFVFFCFFCTFTFSCVCLGQQSELCPSVMGSESSFSVHFLQSLWDSTVHILYISSTFLKWECIFLIITINNNNYY